jgi:hypothetical protein
MNINLDTHRHRQTNQRALVEVGRNYIEAVCPGRFSRTKSVCPFIRPIVRADSVGELKRRTVVFRTPFFRIPFSESDCPGQIPFSESPNPTVRIDSAGELKRGTVVSGPNPVFRIRLSGPVFAGGLKRGTVASRTDR